MYHFNLEMMKLFLTSLCSIDLLLKNNILQINHIEMAVGQLVKQSFVCITG